MKAAVLKLNSRTDITMIKKETRESKESLNQMFTSEPKKCERKKKSKVKRVVSKASEEPCKVEGLAQLKKSEGCFEGSPSLDEQSSEILKDLDEGKEKIVLTKKEKKCLDEILALTSNIQHGDNLTDLNFTPSEPADLSDIAVSINESPSKVMVAELGEVTNYLKSLKTLIAKRESIWAAATEENRSQRKEIGKLNDEISNLLVSCAKKQTEVQEKDRIIVEKDREIVRLQKVVQKLKTAILQLERRMVQHEAGGEGLNQVNGKLNKKSGSEILQSELEQMLMASQKIADDSKKIPRQLEIRKNQGPAAQIANALYNARNAGNFVNF